MTMDDDDDLFADENLVDDSEPAQPPAAAAAEDAQPEFESVYDFVEQHLVFLYARAVEHRPDRRWCGEWWAHPEAVSRLEALWRAYETLRQDPGTGMSVWWRDHADPQMSALMSPDGTFDGCKPVEHKPRATVLPVVPMEDAMVRQLMSVHADEGAE